MNKERIHKRNAAIVRLARAGKLDIETIAGRFGLSVKFTTTICLQAGMYRSDLKHRPRRRPESSRVLAERNKAIRADVLAGNLTLDAIGTKHGLTRERVRQIGGTYRREAASRRTAEKHARIIAAAKTGKDIAEIVTTERLPAYYVRNILRKANLSTVGVCSPRSRKTVLAAFYIGQCRLAACDIARKCGLIDQHVWHLKRQLAEWGAKPGKLPKSLYMTKGKRREAKAVTV